MNPVYQYPELPGISPVTRMAEMPLFWEYFIEYARLKCEQGSDLAAVQQITRQVVDSIHQANRALQNLPDDPDLAAREPDDYRQILLARPEAPHALWQRLDTDIYADRLRGALYGRFAGCTLGAPVEFWSVEEMHDWAAYCGQAFPPQEYWRCTKRPNELRYEVSRFDEYQRDTLTKVPVDDDVTYPLLNLLLLEAHGPHFTVEQAGRVWQQLLPRACTAEEVVLHDMAAGIPADQAATRDNPYRQWLGADIRADAWGYAAPGLPQEAARMAYTDAMLTHRRNGVYGAMYFSAVLAAAFALGDVPAALRAGLNEIPAHCLLARDLRWALDRAPHIREYAQARREVEDYFGWMSGVHTNLNACLTVFGLWLGGRDFGRVIGQITAMGYDNDCNAATAGSIFGAAYGVQAIPPVWYDCFHDRVDSYLNGHPHFSIDDLCARFTRQAQRVWEERL